MEMVFMVLVMVIAGSLPLLMVGMAPPFLTLKVCWVATGERSGLQLLKVID